MPDDTAQIIAQLNTVRHDRDVAVAARQATEAKFVDAQAKLAKAEADLTAAQAALVTERSRGAQATADAQRSFDTATAAAAAAAADAQKRAVAAAAAAGTAAAADRERKLSDEVRAANDAAAAYKKDLDAATLKIGEYQQLVDLSAADPPKGSAITIVEYLGVDGKTVLKRRYRSTDGAKFRLLPDALNRQAVVNIMAALDLPEPQAARIVANAGSVVKHLEPVTTAAENAPGA